MYNRKDIALSYVRRGLSVIPLWSPSELKNKKPKKFLQELQAALAKAGEDKQKKDEITMKIVVRWCKRSIFSWTEYQQKLPTADEVNSWFEQYPEANIGIITGKISNLVTFDLDSKEAVDYVEAEGGFPETVKVKTKKGYHIYLRHPDFEIKNTVNKRLDIDIRAEGGYVAAPPSIHGSGHEYEWEPGYSINEIDPAPCPPWAEDYLKQIQNAPSKQKDEEPEVEEVLDAEAKPVKDQKGQDFTELLKNGCEEGSRNHSATKLIGHLLKTGLPPQEVWEIVKSWNHKNDPPLNEFELKNTFDSINKLNGKQEAPEIKIETLLYQQASITKEYKEDYVRVPFGNRNLGIMEKQLNGGLVGGRLYILGGIPSAGKTALMNCIADNICLNGTPVLVFSFDDGQRELLYRTFARFSKRSIEDFNKNIPTGEEIARICKIDEVSRIIGSKYVIQASLQIESWQKLIDQIKEKHHRGPVIIADYLRKLNSGGKSGDERQRVDNIISALTDLAKENNIPIWVISELARDSYKMGQRLSMASFKESGSIEYEASWLGILAAVDKDKKVVKDWEDAIQQSGTVDLLVFKAKRGTGKIGTIPLSLDKAKMTVSDRGSEDSRQSVGLSRFGVMEGF